MIVFLSLLFAVLGCASGVSPAGLSCDFSSSFCNYTNSHFVLMKASSPHQITCNYTSQKIPYECDLTSAPVQLFGAKLCLEFEYRAVIRSPFGDCIINVDQLVDGSRTRLFGDRIGIDNWLPAKATVQDPGTVKPFRIAITVTRSDTGNELFISPITIREGPCN